MTNRTSEVSDLPDASHCCDANGKQDEHHSNHQRLRQEKADSPGATRMSAATESRQEDAIAHGSRCPASSIRFRLGWIMRRTDRRARQTDVCSRQAPRTLAAR
jgi:hypothetical protein